MKSKRIRLTAKLILGIGVVVGLLACVIALLLSMNNPFGFPTNYVPTTMDFVWIGVELAAVILISIILFVAANGCEKREAIRACWQAAEETPVDEEETEELPEEASETETEDAEAAEEGAETAEEAPKTRLQVVREKIMEKTGLDEEKLEKATKIGKVAIPVGAAVALIAMGATISSYRKKARYRQNFFRFLG